MYPSSNLNYLPHLPSMSNQSLLQALNAQQQAQQIPSTTATQNQAMLQQHQNMAATYMASFQHQLSQQEQNKALAQLSQAHLQSLLSNPELMRMTPQQMQLLNSQVFLEFNELILTIYFSCKRLPQMRAGLH
jgi:hypothetical protein